MEKGDVPPQAVAPLRRVSGRADRRPSVRLTTGLPPEGEQVESLGDLVHGRHARRQNERQAGAGGGQQQGAVGQGAGRQLQGRHVQTVDEEGEALEVERRGQEPDPAVAAIPRDRPLVRLGQYKAVEHGLLVFGVIGSGPLVGRLGRIGRHQSARVEALELHEIRAAGGGGVDERHGQLPIAVVVDAGLGDDLH